MHHVEMITWQYGLVLRAERLWAVRLKWKYISSWCWANSLHLSMYVIRWHSLNWSTVILLLDVWYLKELHFYGGFRNVIEKMKVTRVVSVSHQRLCTIYVAAPKIFYKPQTLLSAILLNLTIHDSTNIMHK